MRLLLDTHALIWWDSNAARLPSAVATQLGNSANDVFISVASAWEMQIKAQLGKLTQNKPWRTVIDEQVDRNGFILLRPDLAHIDVLDTLPLHHRDPFDRLLVAQAIAENMTLISGDAKLTAYPVNLLW